MIALALLLALIAFVYVVAVVWVVVLTLALAVVGGSRSSWRPWPPGRSWTRPQRPQGSQARELTGKPAGLRRVVGAELTGVAGVARLKNRFSFWTDPFVRGGSRTLRARYRTGFVSPGASPSDP
jgi:hypothetical protein